MASTGPPRLKYDRLGTSGFKVCQIFLRCMPYGDPNWGGNWVLAEEEATKHRVRLLFLQSCRELHLKAMTRESTPLTLRTYAPDRNTVSGHAIKKHNLPPLIKTLL
ncbi:hypothetical protein B0H19DRAFT_528936 [Mycena capillaripes]|nr:hypothetical protein B0H19DRAFT_528936 [Mycena capillaripes]